MADGVSSGELERGEESALDTLSQILADQSSTSVAVWWVLLALNFALYAGLGWHAYGHFQIDSYQTAYVVEACARGETPYLDFSYYFGPLAIEVYGAVLRLTGMQLEVIAWLGSLVVALALPLIWCLARELGLPVVGRAGVCFLFLNNFAFPAAFIRLFNWSIPYCHSSTHTILMLLAALLCQRHWRRTGGARWAALWGLCAAGAILNRPDVGVAYAALSLLDLLATTRGRRPTWGREWAAWGVGFLPAVLTYGYFAHLVGWSTLIHENLFWTGHDPRLSAQQRFIFGGTPEDLGMIATILFLHLGAWLLVGRLGDRHFMWTVPLSVVVVVVGFEPLRALLDLPFLLLLLALALRRHLTRDHGVLLALSGVLLARILFRCNFTSYFFYLGVIPMVVGAGLAWQASKNQAQRLLLVGLLFALSAQQMFSNLSNLGLTKLEIPSPVGTVAFLSTPASRSLAALLQDLQTRKAEGKSVLVIPEGALINTLSRTRHPLYHPHMLSTTLAVYGDQALISQIAKAKPEYIVLEHRAAPEYTGNSHFGQSYAVELVAWVKANYQLVASYGPEPFQSLRYSDGGVRLYQRKDPPVPDGTLRE